MRLIMSLVLALSLASVASADLYTDATGDLDDGTVGDDFTGFTHLDIVSLDVQNDATDIMFTLTLNGDISTATGVDWGNYMIAIDSSSSTPGDTAGNAWNRPISMASGMDYWLGSWVNGGGGLQVWNYNDTTPGTWSDPVGNRAVDLSGAAAGVLAFSVSLADLGLSVGDTITVDAFSSGGNATDGAVDALSSATPSIQSWGDSFASPGAAGPGVYTVTAAVPEPTTLSLLALTGIIALGARRLRRK